MEPINTPQAIELYHEFSAIYPWMHTREEATGRCLWSCMEFADMAARKGLAVDLVRWLVLPGQGDPKHSDHWAIHLGRGETLDLTATQINGRYSVWRKVKGYPSNYVAPKYIPARLLLPAFRAASETSDGKLDQRFLNQKEAIFQAYTTKPTPAWVWALRAVAFVLAMVGYFKIWSLGNV